MKSLAQQPSGEWSGDRHSPAGNIEIRSFTRHPNASITADLFQANEDGCKDMSGNFVVRFSKKFQETIRLASRDGSRPVPTGKVNFVVYWQVEDGMEVRVVLPEVGFNRIQNVPI